MERFADYITYHDSGEEGWAGTRAGNALAGTMCAIFRAAGDDFAVALLANSTHNLERWTYNESGKFSRYKWRITVPPSLYVEYKKQETTNEWDAPPDFLSETKRLGGDDLLSQVKEIIVSPRVETDEHWRLGAQAYLAGQGINNQGNVMLTNRPRIVHDELFFRTIEEQYLYDALVSRRLPVMPLPVVLRTDGTKRPDGSHCRIEPDFCILYRGRLIIIELDGGSHVESPADAEKRLQYLREAGAIVRRLKSETCADEEKAKVTVVGLLKSVDSELGSR